MNIQKLKKDFPHDLKSGLSVFFVALPLCLGISLASGAPLAAGVLAGVIGGLVIGSLSGSHVSVSGPAAGLSVIVLNAITDIGSFQGFLAVVLVAGIIQFVFGALKADALTTFISNSVIKGMLSGIGLIIMIKQIPQLTGSKSYTQMSEVLSQLASNTMAALIVSALCMVFLLVVDFTSLKKWKIFNILPSGLWVVLIGTAAAWFLSWQNKDVTLAQSDFVSMGNLVRDDAWAFLTWPDFKAIEMTKLIKYSLLIAVIGSIETLLCIDAGDKLDHFKRTSPTSRELKAQGIGNILSGLLGGLPITSVIVRTSVNINSGARSKMSTVIHGALLFCGLIFIPAYLEKIPLASLAAILIMAGFKLLNFDAMKKMIKQGYAQWLPFFATMIGVVTIDLLSGVLAGIVLSVSIVFWHQHQIHKKMFSPFKRQVSVGKDGHKKYIFSFTSYVSYFQKAEIKNALKNVEEDSLVVINYEESAVIDKDVEEIINEFSESANDMHIKLIETKTSEQNNKKAT